MTGRGGARHSEGHRSQELWRTIGVAVVAVVLGVVLFFNLRATIKDIALQRAARLLPSGRRMDASNVPAGRNDFQYRLGRLSALVLFRSRPIAMFPDWIQPISTTRIRRCLELYDRITLGKEEDPGPLIRDRFGARYVFTDNSHDDFFDNAQSQRLV